MFERKPGVYIIISTVNEKKYVGSSKDVRQRIWDHQSLLRRGKHPNSQMQNSWNKHGEGSFLYDVLEYVEGRVELLQREQHFIDVLLPEFNVRQVAESNLGVKMPAEGTAAMKSKLKGLKRTQETKDRIGAYQRTRKNSPESIQRMREAHANVSEETRLRMSVAKKGIAPVKATEASAKVTRGMTRSQEFRDNVSAGKKGKPVKNQAAASKAGADKTRGKPRSAATSAKIAATVARKKELGLTKHSEATIAKIKAAKQKK